MPALLEIKDLTVAYGPSPTVIGANLAIARGEILALVGESGSGKSTLARAIFGLAPVRSGSLVFDGQNLPATAGKRSVAIRQRIGMVFQDSGSAFNPRFTIERIVGEPLLLAGMRQRRERRQAILALLDDVGLGPELLLRYPNELSGGQRQRVGIVRALACQPDLLICDEAVSALDVSVQAQILNLLVQIQEKRRITLLFITHDLAVVEYLADRIAVMTGGVIVEQGTAADVLDRPQHPYTRGLLAANGVQFSSTESTNQKASHVAV